MQYSTYKYTIQMLSASRSQELGKNCKYKIDPVLCRVMYVHYDRIVMYKSKLWEACPSVTSSELL